MGLNKTTTDLDGSTVLVRAGKAVQTGTAAQNLAYTGELGELTYDTTDDRLVAHDGSTAGGFPVGKEGQGANTLVSIADATNTLSLTAALHANRTCVVLDATLAITLPEATGTGNVYTIVQGIAATSSTIVTADTANSGFHGFIMGSDTDSVVNYNWVATGAEDTITFNGVATGGKLYDWIKVTDMATDAWLLEGMIRQSGASEATPLSSAA